MWRALVVAMISSASLFAQSAGPRLGPRDMAILLASRQVPAGVVAPTVIMSVGPPPPPSPAGETDDALLARFTGSLPSFDAVRDGAIVHILPKDLPPRIRERLDQRLNLDSTRDTTAVGMVVRFADTLRGRISPGAVAGGGLPGPKCPLANTVHISDTPLSVQQALDQVVKQVPGLVWVVTYDSAVPDLDFALGLMCGGGETVLVEVAR
jgi:hypothetical protein